MIATEPIPGMDEEIIRLDHLRAKQEARKFIKRMLDEAQDDDRPCQLEIAKRLCELARECHNRGWHGLASEAYAANRAVKGMGR